MLGLNFEGLAFSFRGPACLLDCMSLVTSRVGQSAMPLDTRPRGSPADLAGEIAVASVACELREMAEAVRVLPTDPNRGWLRWEWSGSEASVSTLGARARISRRGFEYAVEAWLSPDQRAARTLLSALHSAILHDLGGLILHSASVLGDEGVVAFVGPSGAGKSTACGHMRGTPIFSVDRMAVLPRARKTESEAQRAVATAWYAYPLFGGTSIHPDKPVATSRWSPLRAILRVQKAQEEARLEGCSRASAVAWLRESTFHGCPGVGAENEILGRLESLAGTVRVGRVYFSLGPSLTLTVSRWLSH